MYYCKKKSKNYEDENTDKEELERQYSRLKQVFPTITRKTIVILGIILLVLNSTHIFSFHSDHPRERHAQDGAGDYWTCRWCGYSSNKCYEMSCSQCGRSR